MATTSYNALGLVGAFVPTGYAPLPLVGLGVGFSQIVVTSAADRTAHDVAADGATMVSYIANRTGGLSIEVQQTSLIDQYFMSCFNFLEAAAIGGDASNWAGTIVTLKNAQHAHELSGVSFTKPPDRTYAAQGGKVTWAFMSAHVVTL